MSSSRQNDSCNWLLVEWKSGGRDVVYIRSVLSPLNKELRAGDQLTVNRRGEPEAATLHARARERDVLDTMLKETGRKEEAGPSVKHEEEPEDYSSSASSWVPSDDGAQSGDSAGEKNKKVKLERCKRQYSNRRSSKKIMTPSHRANPVIPKIMQQANMLNRKRTYDSLKNASINKTIPDSTRKNNQNVKGQQNVTIDVRELMNIKNSFQVLFNMLEDLKRPVSSAVNQSSNDQTSVPFKPEDSHVSYNRSVDELKEDDENSENEEFNRSDDNVLISNKYTNVAVKTVQNKGSGKDEWVPIGSGKTLIHRDQFKRVNWKSYTIATRTLLLAVFPRRILATHSLTGKRSPAFQDKPAKMCLDPKIISDVIMEIMDRFNVRENLVRSIITTKCADECKMWKTRVSKNNKKKSKNHENIPPSNNNLEDKKVM
uniref:BEN domain-containing protein n=1 Tax=Heliothis virescens TaxID=7102 RepID=A0A2A4K211_HELVI